MEYLKEDPSAGLAQDRRRAVKNHQVWSQEECELFIETHEKELRALPIILILHTGMRIGEAITLRWSDIDFEERTVLVKRSVSDHNRSAHQNEKAPKNGHSRLIVLSDLAIDYLKSMKRVQASHQLSKGYWNDDDYVCLNTLGRPFSSTIVHRSFNWLTELMRCSTDPHTRSASHTCHPPTRAGCASESCARKTRSCELYDNDGFIQPCQCKVASRGRRNARFQKKCAIIVQSEEI
ncbi:tyrosine-type recombinase/integrase [Exiguobacterium sp. SL14]|nr:tyrosine-type recombinase/integrase [Exiguobacterium sp. SL14]MCY1690697.1 tyrosine-type recombinase/integrase [Exiguobacterium sp. SL14]